MTEPLDRLKAALADRYAIERELGAGGMATVYLAHDQKHDRMVAVKVMRPELSAILGGERFLQEIRIAAQLNHPHILALHDSGNADGFLYYVMPHVEGESLRANIDRQKQLAIDEAETLTRQVASALDYAHEQGVIHRDIKPENILLHRGEAVVADFGIAFAVTAAGGERLTETGLSLGTPEYMSPEQVAGDRDVDARSDIYSLGAVLYEMVTGEPPQTGATVQAVIAKLLTQTPMQPRVVRDSVPEAMDRAIMKALAKVPTDRFDSSGEFATALTAEVAEPEEEVKSIVVLPFENLSPDPDQEYFADGLTEEVIADLSTVRSLRVISRSSAMTFKGSDKRIPEIAKELNVRYALEGSVRKAGNSLRITAQLIDSTDDSHLWADKYTGTLDDVFEMQEGVSQSIVEALQLTLTPVEERQMAERPIENAQVLDYYLKARHEANSFTKAGVERALEHLQSGLTIIGENALLYSGIAYTYYQSANVGMGQEEEIDLAEDYARKALELDPGSAEAHLTLGLTYSAFRGDQRRACDHFNLSLATRPDDAHTLSWLVVVYWYVGKLDAAIPLMHKALELDPLDPLVRWLPACVDLGVGRFKEAAEFAWHQLPPLPNFVLFHALALAWAGRLEDARALIVENVKPETDDAFVQMTRLLMAGIATETDEIMSLLSHDETRRTLRRDPVSSYLVATICALGGLNETALDWLENAVNKGFIHYPMLAAQDPFLTRFRGKPEYEALLERVKREWEEFEV